MKSTSAIFFFCLCSVLLMGQDRPDPVFIHPLVGSEITFNEVKEYKLTPYFTFAWNNDLVMKLYPGQEESQLILVVSNLYDDEEVYKNLTGEVWLGTLRDQISEKGERKWNTFKEFEQQIEDEGKVWFWVKTYYGYETSGYAVGSGDGYFLTDEGEKIFWSKIKFLSLNEETGKRPPWKRPTSVGVSYLFSQSAFPLDKGELNYRNILLTANSLHYGVSDRLSVSGGVEIGSTITGLVNIIEESSFNNAFTYAFLDVKYSLVTEGEVKLATGVLAGGAIGNADYPFFPTVYAVGTIGEPEKNLSAGLYVPFAFSAQNKIDRVLPGSLIREISEQRFTFPILVVSGLKKNRENFYLFTENFFYGINNNQTFEDQFGLVNRQQISTFYGVLSGGVRWTPGRSTWNFGLMIWGANILRRETSTTQTSTSIFPIPYVAYSLRIK
ncbi:MAG: hypothetical protein AAFY71_02455 [Bacteroidota bacterium]